MKPAFKPDMKNAPLDAVEFLRSSPEEQAVTIARRMPRFATMPKDEQQRHLGDLRERLTLQMKQAEAAQGDTVGRMHTALTKDPGPGGRTAVSRALFGDTVGSWDMPGRFVRSMGRTFLPRSNAEAARMAATAPIGGGVVTGPVLRTGVGALAGAVTTAAQGDGPIKGGVEQGIAQGVGELVPAGLRFGATQRAARPFIAARNAKTAHDRSMHEAVSTTETAAHRDAVAAVESGDKAAATAARTQHTDLERDLRRQHATQKQDRTRQHETATEAARAQHAQETRAYEARGATAVADAFKQRVGAWQGIESSERGLLDMVYGKGPRLASARYDEALRDVVRTGRGQQISVRSADAERLGIEPRARVDAEPGQTVMVMIDAGRAAEAVTGRWKKDPGLYRRVVGALDDANIGDPAARGEYRASQALIQFTDRSQMLKGERFNADAALAGFTKLKNVDELRRRGAGNIFEGPVSDAVRTGRPGPLQLPAEPPPVPEPRIPAFAPPAPSPKPDAPAPRTPPKAATLPDGVKTKTVDVPPWEGAALAEIPFLVAGLVSGQGHYTGYGLPAALGALGAHSLRGREIATQAPLSPATTFALRIMPTLGAQATDSVLAPERAK